MIIGGANSWPKRHGCHLWSMGTGKHTLYIHQFCCKPAKILAKFIKENMTKKNTPNPHQSQARCCIPTRGAQDEVAVCTLEPAKRSTRIPRFELEESFLCICVGLYKVSLIIHKRKQQVPARWQHPWFIFHHHSSSLHTLAAHFHLLPV